MITTHDLITWVFFISQVQDCVPLNNYCFFFANVCPRFGARIIMSEVNSVIYCHHFRGRFCIIVCVLCHCIAKCIHLYIYY